MLPPLTNLALALFLLMKLLAPSHAPLLTQHLGLRQGAASLQAGECCTGTGLGATSVVQVAASAVAAAQSM